MRRSAGPDEAKGVVAPKEMQEQTQRLGARAGDVQVPFYSEFRLLARDSQQVAMDLRLG